MAGSAVIGSLRVNLGIDSAEFSKGAKAAQSTLGALAGSFKAFAIGALGALSFGAVTTALKSAVNKADELGKAAQKIGIPVEELSKLEYAAKLADVSLEQLSTGIGKLSKNMAAIAGGQGGDAGRALSAIGVSATTASGQLRPTSAVIADVAEKFAAMKDGAGKTAIAMALFGKSGAELIPLLNAGKTGLAEAANEASRLGIVIDTQTARAAENFNDNLTRLHEAAGGLTQQLAAAMLPALNDLTNAFVANVSNGNLAASMASGLNTVIAESKRFLLEASAAWKELTIWSTAFVENLKALGNLDFSSGTAIWTKAAADVKAAWAETQAQIEGTAQTVNTMGKGDLPTAQTDAPIIKTNELTNSVKALGNAGSVAGAQLSSAFGQVGESAETLGQQIGQTLGSTLQDWIGQAIDGTFKLKDAMKDLLGQLSRLALNSFLQKLMGGLGGGGGTSGGFFSSIGKLFGFAQGGSFKVGGAGGIDSQVVAFRATPGERVDVSTKGQQRSGGIPGDDRPNMTSITFNVSTPDVAGFKRSQSQMAALLTQSVARGQRNL